ncbi:hypothetical protein C7476_101331 [Phyllobacterium bourgognense]|uniref:Uncharacterized protein n=1 Tax=Phyllobacterium bourgognense TaxID=314236 RepID=A0A368Z544_9HYPH|nr:hypothetical protein C7476_101331 [Phyllobacterium bourgognense]
MALEELKVRSDQYASMGMERFLVARLRPIPWLKSARAAVRNGLRRSLARPTDKANLYVVLRDGYTDFSGYYGAYVGVTAKSVEERFLQHRQGVRPARGLPDHGIELLYSLFIWSNPICSNTIAGGQQETNVA